MDIILTKTLKSGRFWFHICAYDDCTVQLVRLPKIDIGTLNDEGSQHDPQMCCVCYKPIIIEQEVNELVDNSGHESRLFVVSEYVGRETASANLTPDTALDGFLEWEIDHALKMLDQDKELVKRLENRLADILLVEK